MNTKKFSKLGFGLMRLPEKDGAIDHDALCAMVDAYMEQGFSYFDTAYMYCNGQSEPAIREALVKRYPRESFMLVDKLPQWQMSGIDDRDRIFNDQLQRTGVEYFDVYLLHSVEDGANYDGYVKYDCFNWLRQKKTEGLMRHIGFSFHGTPELLDKILTEHPEIDLVQVQLNYADWDNPLIQSRRLHEVLCAHHMPTIVMEPVKGGALANVPAQAEQAMKHLRPQASPASWALRFAASLEGVVTVLSGMSDQAQIKDNLRTFTGFEPLNQEELKVIELCRDALLTSPAVQCTACRYCCDGCPSHIAIPDVFKALSGIRLFKDDRRPQMVYDKIIVDHGRAKDCVSCGQCEAVCPQHLPIIELLNEASQRLDTE